MTQDNENNSLNIINRYDALTKVAAIFKRAGSYKRISNVVKSKICAKFKITSGINFYPTQISIEPTTLCNYACPACYHGLPDLEGKPGGTRPKFMDFDSYKKLIDEIGNYTWYLNLTGEGESFLHPRIYDMIRYASDKGIFVNSESNASKLDIEALANSGIGAIHFALDGFTPETYSKYRVNGNFDKVLKNITAFCEYVERNKIKTKILVRYLINSYTEKEVNEAREYFKRFPNVSLYNDYFFMPPASAKIFKQYQDATTEEIYNEWTPREMTEYDVYMYHEETGYYRLKSLANPISGNCVSPFGGAVLNADGGLYPCCIAAPHEPKPLHYGNVFEEGFMPVWKSAKAKKFRQNYKSNNGDCFFCNQCSENH